MRNNKNSVLLFFISILAVILGGCDKIDAPFKETQNITDTIGCKAAEFASQAVVKNVLLEEYTGHTCGNCPASHKISASLKQLYAERLVIISVHAGLFAKPQNNANGAFAYDFRTPAGDERNNTFGNDLAGLPNGMVDGGKILSPSAWGTEVQKEISLTPLAGLQLVNNFDPSTKRLCTSVQAEFLNSMNGTYKLALYLVEDSIIQWQKDYTKSPNNIPDYLHRHVLRSAINSSFGETIARGQINAGTKLIRNYKTMINTSYKPANCSVVAVITDSTTAMVIQVLEQKISP